MFGDSLPRGASQWPEGIFYVDKGRAIHAFGRRAFTASLLVEIGKGGQGEKEILRSKRRGREIHEARSALPELPLPAEERRKEERRRPKVRMPGLRPPFVRHDVHIVVILETQLSNDPESGHPDIPGLPRLGDLMDTRDRSENRPVLEGQVPGRQPKMVGGIDAFQSRLDRRDALCADKSGRPCGRGLDDIRREDSKRRLLRDCVRFRRRRLLQALFGKARHPDEGHGRRSSGREDRERVQTDPRRGACPQSPGEEIGVGGRLVQIRARRQGIRVQNEADEQLLQLPQAFLRIPLRDQIHQT